MKILNIKSKRTKFSSKFCCILFVKPFPGILNFWSLLKSNCTIESNLMQFSKLIFHFLFQRNQEHPTNKSFFRNCNHLNFIWPFITIFASSVKHIYTRLYKKLGNINPISHGVRIPAVPQGVGSRIPSPLLKTPLLFFVIFF